MTHDLSPWSMFLHADLVVRLVMIGLALASVATWTVLLAKSWELRTVRRRLAAGRAILAEASSLYEAKRQLTAAHGPALDLVEAAATESRQSADLPPAGIKERTASRLDDELAQLGRSLTVGTGILATIGSVGPFVGLFGTVWGIMNSFIGIAHSQTTNLAVVAPGIAEALLATGMGLIAAIPAVVVYFSPSRRMSARLTDGGDDLELTHEINVTPFIDVILVLLIIFMVAAPLATVEVPVDLPDSTAHAQPKPDQPVFVTIKADQSLAVGEDAVAEGELAARLDAASKGDNEARIFLRADKSIAYGRLMAVMDGLRAAGYLKVALVGLETR